MRGWCVERWHGHNSVLFSPFRTKDRLEQPGRVSIHAILNDDSIARLVGGRVRVELAVVGLTHSNILAEDVGFTVAVDHAVAPREVLVEVREITDGILRVDRVSPLVIRERRRE